jgi:hypothetical protein
MIWRSCLKRRLRCATGGTRAKLSWNRYAPVPKASISRRWTAHGLAADLLLNTESCYERFLSTHASVASLISHQ